MQNKANVQQIVNHENVSQGATRTDNNTMQNKTGAQQRMNQEKAQQSATGPDATTMQYKTSTQQVVNQQEASQGGTGLGGSDSTVSPVEMVSKFPVGSHSSPSSSSGHNRYSILEHSLDDKKKESTYPTRDAKYLQRLQKH